jgi:hypothetical protein
LLDVHCDGVMVGRILPMRCAQRRPQWLLPLPLLASPDFDGPLVIYTALLTNFSAMIFHLYLAR